MAVVRYCSLLVHLLLPGASNLHSNGPVDRIKAMPYSSLCGVVLLLRFSGVLLHVLLWMHRAHQTLLEDLDRTESSVAYCSSQRSRADSWHCVANEKQPVSKRKCGICLGVVKLLLGQIMCLPNTS